jgi:hypothetical protein
MEIENTIRRRNTVPACASRGYHENVSEASDTDKSGQFLRKRFLIPAGPAGPSGWYGVITSQIRVQSGTLCQYLRFLI